MLDELEQYLANEEDFDLEKPVLKWWHAKEDKWPNLAKMVKQCFAAPAFGWRVRSASSARPATCMVISQKEDQGGNPRGLSLRCLQY